MSMCPDNSCCFIALYLHVTPKGGALCALDATADAKQRLTKTSIKTCYSSQHLLLLYIPHPNGGSCRGK